MHYKVVTEQTEQIQTDVCLVECGSLMQREYLKNILSILSIWFIKNLGLIPRDVVEAMITQESYLV